MTQLSRGLGLAQKARLDGALKCELRRQNLDGNVALQPLISGAIHHAHAASPDLTVQLVVSAQDSIDVRAELCARRRRRGVERNWRLRRQSTESESGRSKSTSH